MLDRRQLLSGAAIAGGALALPLTVRNAAAQATDASTQAPAFHKMKVGDIEVTALADGHLSLGAQVFPETSEDEFAAAMEAAYLPAGAYTAPVNAYLVTTGDRTILIDAGGSAAMAPSLGKLAENLAAAGASTDAVDTVLITHLHPDHIGGLSDGDSAAFANAEIMVREEEAQFWTDPATREALPDGFKPMFDGVGRTLGLYDGRVTRFADDGEKAPGVEAVFLPGHTPGHTGFRVTSGDDALLVWGDIVHAAPLQMPHPRAFIGFDTAPEMAVETRMKLLDEVATDRVMVAGMHMPFPGFGFIAPDGDGYRFVRTDWQY
ncbi:MAG: MBL fold metallo-hydrolase [Pseudomonadota bacterium]